MAASLPPYPLLASPHHHHLGTSSVSSASAASLPQPPPLVWHDPRRGRRNRVEPTEGILILLTVCFVISGDASLLNIVKSFDEDCT